MRLASSILAAAPGRPAESVRVRWLRSGDDSFDAGRSLTARPDRAPSPELGKSPIDNNHRLPLVDDIGSRVLPILLVRASARPKIKSSSSSPRFKSQRPKHFLNNRSGSGRLLLHWIKKTFYGRRTYRVIVQVTESEAPEPRASTFTEPTASGTAGQTNTWLGEVLKPREWPSTTSSTEEQVE